MNKNVLIFFVLFFCFFVAFVNGELIHYYDFDNTNHNSSIILDIQSSSNLILSSSNLGLTACNSTQGILGNGTYCANNVVLSTYNASISDIDSIFTINMWRNNSSPAGSVTDLVPKWRLYNSNISMIYFMTDTIKYANGLSLGYYNGTYNPCFNFTISIVPSLWVMYTITYDGATVKYYRNGVLNLSTICSLPTSNINKLLVGEIYGQTFDELSIYNNVVTAEDILELYNNGAGKTFNQTKTIVQDTIQPSTPLVAIQNINTKVINGALYIYPQYAGQNSIIGYYDVGSDFTPTYYGRICDYNTTINTVDYFTGITQTNTNGWSGYYNTSVFSAQFGLSMYFGGTYAGDTRKLITSVAKNLEVSYIIYPHNTPFASFDDSSSIYVTMKTSTGQILTPIEYRYNYTNSETCLYSLFSPSEQLILCVPTSNEGFVSTKMFIDFKGSKTYTLKVVGSDGIVRYSAPKSLAYLSATDIGQIYINPDYNTNYTELSTPNSYFDNLLVMDVNVNYPNLILSNTTNLSIVTDYSCAINYDNCDCGVLTCLELALINPTFIEACAIDLCSATAQTVFNTYTDFFTTSCDYSELKCYNTRIYTYPSAINSYNNYAEFDLCSLTSAKASLPNYITDNLINNQHSQSAQAFILTIPIEWRYIIMIVLSFFVLILPMILAGKEGVLAGLAFSAVLCIALTIVFSLSIIIPIMYTILSAGIFAIMVRSTMTG